MGDLIKGYFDRIRGSGKMSQKEIWGQNYFDKLQVLFPITLIHITGIMRLAKVIMLLF